MAWFGASVQKVVDRLPTGLTVCDLGSEAVVEALLSIYYNRLLGDLSPTTFEQLARPDKQLLLNYTNTTTTTATVGLFPIVSNSSVRLFFCPDMYDSEYQLTQVENVSVNYTTGVLTFPVVQPNVRLWASYEVDLTLVEIPSLANLIVTGVAGELLVKNVPEGQFGYKIGEIFLEMWNSEIKRLKDNDQGIPELRKLQFWNEYTDMPSVISMRKHRGA